MRNGRRRRAPVGVTLTTPGCCLSAASAVATCAAGTATTWITLFVCVNVNERTRLAPAAVSRCAIDVALRWTVALA